MLHWLYDAASAMAGLAIRSGIRATGRRVNRNSALWLDSPMGGPRIGSEFYRQLQERENLLLPPDPNAGLLTSMEQLDGVRFSANDIDKRIRDFYEHTTDYKLEAWSESKLLTRGFLWGLTTLVSRKMDQLNFPVSSLELARGMTSQILPLVDSEGHRRYTGWLRTMVSTNRVIYTGLYSVATPSGHDSPCVKVSFPLPYGSATVFLRAEAQLDGSLKLISSGNTFGDPGFYRMVQLDEERWVVRYLRTLREHFHVYVDEFDVLRTDHTVSFLGQSVLRLHYRMDRINKPVNKPVVAQQGNPAGVAPACT